jgi:hypothetical protein
MLVYKEIQALQILEGPAGCVWTLILIDRAEMHILLFASRLVLKSARVQATAEAVLGAPWD